MKLSTVLLYSTIDFRWLKECLESSSKISTEVVLSSCDRLWNGQEENKNLLDKTKDIIASFPNVKPISVKWQPGYKHFFGNRNVEPKQYFLCQKILIIYCF